jgi:hypothetical protein
MSTGGIGQLVADADASSMTKGIDNLTMFNLPPEF